LDKNEYHVYHLIKESSAFTYAYADIIVISIIVFMVVFIVYAAFALITFLLKLTLGSLTLTESLHSALYFILVGISLGLTFLSIKYTLSLPLPLIYALLLIKLSVSSSKFTYRHFSNVTNILFPLTLSLALHIDTYMIDAWRLHHTYNPLKTTFHYQDSNLSQAKFAHLIYMLSTLFLSNDLPTVVEAYGRYGRHTQLLVALFGIVATGQFVYRIKTVMAIALVVQSVVMIAYVG
jgi:hypothetical protein